MISSLLASVLFAATPDFSAAVTEARRAFIEDGEARVSATPTHRVVSHADGSLELQGGQSLRVSLQAVRREGGPPCRATAKSRAVDATSPRTVRTQRACALEERWTNGREGLEQTFILQRPPAGTGALTLSLSVRGPWHHHDVNGQVFSGPGAVNFLRYGNAFVVRAGRKWPIEVTHVEEGLELKVPRELVEAPGAFPMVIDPIVSTEVPLDPLIGAPVPLPGNEQSPALALNGLDQPMVVWVDDRRQNGTDIFGARLDAAGGLVDLKGIPVALDRLHQLEPTICADGDGWLIAFASERPAGGYLIRGVRVDVNGSPTAPFDIDSGRQPSLASKHNNGDSLIAYVDTSSAVKVSTITSSGSISNEGTSDILQGAASRPFIAATNGEWYVAWESKLGSTPSTIRGMSPSALLGQVFEGPVSPAASIVPATKPTVAYGASFVPSDAVYVYWEQGTEVAGKRVGSLMTDNPISNARSPALVRTSTMQGSKPTLGYISQGQLTLVDLSNTGTMPSRLTVSARAKDLALAANGTGGPIFGAWSEDPALGTDVWAALLGSGAVQPAVVAMGPPSQRLSHVAFAEGLDEGLAVWVEGAGLVLGARAQLQNDGGVVIASPFQIVSNSGVAGLDVAASTADGGYLTVWQTVDGGVQGAISNLDRVVSTLLINQSGATAGPAVAWDEVGSSWVVAWGANAPKTRTVSGTSNQGLAIPRGTGLVSDLDLTCLKGKCLLASERSLTRDVETLLFSPAATALSTPVNTSPAAQPVVTHDGINFVVGYRTPGSFDLVQVGFTNGAHTFIVAVPQPMGGRLGSLSLAPGTPAVMAWSEFDFMTGGSSISVERVSSPLPGTRVFAADGLALSIGTRGLTGEPTGVLVYGRYDSDPNVQTVRGWARTFSFQDAGIVDGGVMDAGVDGGVMDAGVDGGVMDAGMDAGVDDAGVWDAGIDAGVDGGDPARDAGFEAPDAGPLIFTSSGCTCQSLASAPLALALLLLLRRRR